VSSLECIVRLFVPIMKRTGWDDADLVLKGAVADALVLLSADPLPTSPTLEQATEYGWRSYNEWWCAASNNTECKMGGHTFDELRVMMQSDPVQMTGGTVQLSEESAKTEPVGIARAHCQQTHAETVRDVERGHGLQPESLAALAGGLQALQEQGVPETHILRLVAAHVVEEASTLGLLESKSSSPLHDALAVALAHIVRAHDLLLLALGEPANLEKDESVQAMADGEAFVRILPRTTTKI